MKKNHILFFLLTITVLFNSCGPSKNEAINWNDSIIAIEDEVNNSVEKFTNALDVEGADLNKELDNAIKTAEAAAIKMKAIPDFENGSAFKAAGIESINLYLAVLKTDFKSMINLSTNPDATEADFDKVKDHLSAASSKIDDVDNKFIAAQKDFAAKWGFELEK